MNTGKATRSSQRSEGPSLLALYILSLSMAAGLLGVYVRQILTMLGLTTGVEAGALLVASVAAAYVAIQCLLMAGLRTLQPTQSRATMATEVLSNASAFLLLPYLLRVEIEWPHSILERAEPLVFLGGVVVLHLFFKMATFYAGLEGAPAPRYRVLGWITCGVLAGVAAALGGLNVGAITQENRPVVSTTLQQHRVGNTYAQARPVAEGSVVDVELLKLEQAGIRLYWAKHPGSDPEAEDIDRLYFTVQFNDADRKVVTGSVLLSEDDWADARIGPDEIPVGATQCRVRWSSLPQPNWQRILGLNPVIYTPPRSPGEALRPPAEVLLAGPYAHRSHAISGERNMVVVLLEGLSARHLSVNGYQRDTTPTLDALAKQGILLTDVRAPVGGSTEVWGALLLADSSSYIPETFAAAGYETVAFSEGELSDERDVVAGTGLEHGFETFNPSVDETSGVDSSATVSIFVDWAETRGDETFFAVIRLRELREARDQERYDARFVAEDLAPRPVDTYDAALAHLDAQLGRVVASLRRAEILDKTCFVITSSEANAYSADGRRISAGTESLPAIIRTPAMTPRVLDETVSMSELGATILVLAGLELPENVPNSNLLSSRR